MRILVDAILPHISTFFPNPFIVSTYLDEKELLAKLPGHQILVCRSTLKVNKQLLLNSSIECVATASSGTEHIEQDFLKKQGIIQFDAKGCNAISVADYLISTLAWLKQQNLLNIGKAGLIGGGETGSAVRARLMAMGYETICYDPIKATAQPTSSYCSLTELYQCNLLSIHANLHNTPPFSSQNLINEHFLSQLKADTILINAARGGIVNEAELVRYSSKQLTYCTDVYQREPAISKEIIDYSTLCTPHIAGHSLEGKIKAVNLISQKIHDYYGFIRPTINLSSVKLTLPAGQWDEIALSLYNPFIDTQKLKSARNKEQTFLELRAAHQYRHDFNCYDNIHISEKAKKILGK